MYERNVEDAFTSGCHKRGAWHIKAERLWRGFPDRIVFAPGGRFFLVELKRPGGVLEPAQIAIRAWLRRLGFEVHLCWTHEQVAKFFEEKWAA